MPGRSYTIVEARIPVGPAHYPRPGLVIAIVDESFHIVAISSRMPLYNASTDFLIPDTHPDFPATGLARTSYAMPELSYITQQDIIRILGHVQGNLADSFAKWFGDD